MCETSGLLASTVIGVWNCAVPGRVGSAAVFEKMPWFLVLILVAVLDALPVDVSCVRLDDIYWNSSNPIFRIDNTDHIIDVNKNNIPFEYDQVNIICPVYSTSTDQEDAEKYIIYNVSKEEYDACTITNPHPRIIARCEKPHSLMYVTITFRSFTPQPGGLEFRPGQDYYFISTSSKQDLHSRNGGRCLTHNMRIIFKVCCDPSKVTPTPRITTSKSTSPMSTALITTTRRRIYTTSTSTWPTYTIGWTKTTSEVKKLGDKHPDKPNKKTGREENLPNETSVKNEELVNGSSSLDFSGHSCVIIMTNLWTLVIFMLLNR